MRERLIRPGLLCPRSQSPNGFVASKSSTKVRFERTPEQAVFPGVGVGVAVRVGVGVGARVGVGLGARVGVGVGARVGVGVGTAVKDGVGVGARVGVGLGFWDGVTLAVGAGDDS